MCNVNVMNPQITLPDCAVPLSSAQRFSLVSPLSMASCHSRQPFEAAGRQTYRLADENSEVFSS